VAKKKSKETEEQEYMVPTVMTDHQIEDLPEWAVELSKKQGLSNEALLLLEYVKVLRKTLRMAHEALEKTHAYDKIPGNTTFWKIHLGLEGQDKPELPKPE